MGRGTWIFPVEPSMRLVGDTIEYCAHNVPRYSAVSVCGYHIRESGATPAQEMAYGLAIAKASSAVVQLELSALQIEGQGEIISSPRVITANQKKAVIEQGVEIPYQEATSSGATSVSFKEAVLQLEVTPHITPDDRVIMDLKVNKDNPDFTRAVLGVPPVDTRELETSVLVDNGETVVLGGVFERTKSEQTERVPFFGDLPYLGFMFKQVFAVI